MSVPRLAQLTAECPPIPDRNVEGSGQEIAEVWKRLTAIARIAGKPRDYAVCGKGIRFDTVVGVYNQRRQESSFRGGNIQFGLAQGFSGHPQIRVLRLSHMLNLFECRQCPRGI